MQPKRGNSHKTNLERFIYKEDFESCELHAWASYPPNQDTAYDPYIYPGKIKPDDKGICLVAQKQPLWNQDHVVGAVKLLDIILDRNFFISFKYYIKTVNICSYLRIHLPLCNGKRLIYEIPNPPLNQWADLLVKWPDLKSQKLVADTAEDLRITAVAVTVQILKADTDMPIYFALDDIKISGMREKLFKFIEPEVVALSEWKEKIPLKHYESGEKLILKGKYDFSPEKGLLQISAFTDRSKIILKSYLRRDGKGIWKSKEIRLSDKNFPAGLYYGKILANNKNKTVSRTFFTLFVISHKEWETHPRVLFDKKSAEKFINRISSKRFRPVLNKFLSKAKSYREQIKLDKIVYDIDQFPVKDWIPSLEAWYTDRFMTFREAIFTNAISYASGKDEKAGIFCKNLLVKLAKWPQWNHPWMENRGFHTYYPLGEFADAFSVGYDMIYDLLKEEERKIIREGLLRNFIIPAYKTYVEDNQVTSNSSNWISHIAGGALVSLMAIYRDDSHLNNTEPWLTGFILKENKYIKTVFGKDGSYGEGYRYYNFAMQSFAKTLPPLRRLFKVDLTKPIDGSYQETLWAAIIPGNTAFTFGDTESYLKKEAQAWWIGSESGPMNNWAWLLNLYKDSYLSWLYHCLKDFDTLQEVLYETDDIKPKNPSALGDVKFFRDIGTAVFKSGWGIDDFIFVFRSGPFYNHQHMDQGSFYFADFGKIFLKERYDGEHHYYDDPVYRSHAIQTISHNTILIDRNPQSQKVGDPSGFAEGMKDQALFSRWLDSDAFSFVSGNLEGIYRERLKELRRNVLYIKPRSILLVDEIVPDKENVEVNLLFHPEWKKDINIKKEYTAFTKGKAALYLFHLLPMCLKREILQEPHFLCQYKTQPLVERGYLQVSGKTENKKLIFANFMSATREGQPPPLKISTTDNLTVIDSSIQGIHNTIVVNTGKLINYRELSADALILAENDRSNIFAAGGTFIKKDGETLFRSKYPIVVNIHINDREIILTYHLSKSSKIHLKVDSKPRKIDLNGKIVREYSFDSNNSTITLNIPSGEGKVRVI